jgi:cyclic pyranopterin monophosphate synthase
LEFDARGLRNFKFQIPNPKLFKHFRLFKRETNRGETGRQEIRNKKEDKSKKIKETKAGTRINKPETRKMDKLSHTDESGKANMVDVGHKAHQLRIAKGEGFISLQPETVKLVNENNMKKGDVLTVAQLAGIQAAKLTSSIIPLCHNLLITKVDVRLILESRGVTATSEVHCIGPTGVEMEALTAVSASLLTVYDMCKAVDKNMEISNIKLTSKSKTDI